VYQGQSIPLQGKRGHHFQTSQKIPQKLGVE
jgi:hypothetical protein